MQDALTGWQQPVVYAAVGASDTLGEGADDPESEGWVSVLHSRFPRGSVLHRLGASGATAADALARLVPRLEPLDPDVVTIWLAVNDFKRRLPLEDYLGSLERIVGGAAATGATVLVGNLPNLDGMPDFADFSSAELRQETARWNDGIARIAASLGAILVDIMSASDGLGDERSYLLSDDMFHPSTLGHLALAEVFCHYLELAGQGQQASL